MTRTILTAIALGCLAAPALAQSSDTPAPAPVVVPAPEDARTEMTPRPETATPASRKSCGRDRHVMS
ncbi:hypothetical protein [Paracoccus beibuensis]|uniref:hypothetical protein n=1 Tax=Paracoccus beibuensis TaxID=547602 RepID=UPI00223FBE3F|nr:hypothetical protein [Paracoccus beibuensis]